jgi:RNA methyltransferase, trmA family
VKILAENGYVLRKITPVDMFPQTGHIEVCCLLVREQ